MVYKKGIKHLMHMIIYCILLINKNHLLSRHSKYQYMWKYFELAHLVVIPGFLKSNVIFLIHIDLEYM